MKYRTFAESSIGRVAVNSKGVSLVEALLALGLISIIAMSSMSFFSEVSKLSHRSRETCRVYNLSFLERIRSYGVIRSIGNFVPTNVINFVSTPLFPSPPEVSDSVRWPAEPILSSASASEAYINNYLLIDGYMNVLQSLYNANPNICSTFTSIGSTQVDVPDSLMLTYPDDLKDPTGGTGMKIKIVPYKIDTGILENCSAVGNILGIAPRGNHLVDGAGASPFIGAPGAQKKLSKPTNFRSDIGFAVQVQTEFLDEKGEIDSCFTASKFQYPIDTNAPPEPRVLSLTSNGPPANCTPAGENVFTLDVGYDLAVPGSRIEPGSVLLCQDLSVMPTVGRNIAGQNAQSIACKIGNASTGDAPPGNQMSAYLPANSYYPTAGTTGFDYSSLGSIVPPKWVPCYELTLCGVARTSVADTSSLPNKLTYRLQYDDLPSDCRIIVKVAGVDTAVNPSIDHDSDSLADFTSNSPATSIWDVPRPKCNQYCPTGVWPAGYFTCGSC